MVRGSCICESVVFTLEGEPFDIVQCHCSKCRKSSGSSADAMITVDKNKFSWIEGQDFVKVYKGNSGSQRSFCQNCGTSLPVLDGEKYWVPAGVLNGEYEARVKAHIYVGSKTSWDEIGGDAPQYQENIPDDFD